MDPYLWNELFDMKHHGNVFIPKQHSISGISTFNLQTILFGDENLNLFDNQGIFHAVHTSIRYSGRFSGDM